MAKKPKQETDEEIDAVAADHANDESATDAVFAEEEFVASEAGAGRSSTRFSTLLGVTAVLIASIALAGFFYLAFASGSDAGDDDRSAADLAALSTSIRQNEASLAALQANLSALENNSGASRAETDALEQRLESRLRALAPVNERIRRLETSFSALQGISTGVQDTWLLAETEYYMQIANAQLQLAGNPHLATLALRLADERLLQLADPAFTDVRRVLSNELRALEVIEKPDIEGATLTLASLSGVVDSLPLRQEVQASPSVIDTPDAELSGVDRAYASLKGAIGDVVTVRRTDEAVRPLIAPEAIYFLRANLSLQLQTARLALLRGEQAVFQQSLDDAATWIAEYYDTQSTPVRSSLQTIREIRNSSFVSALPDISESLRLLRQHGVFNAAVEAADRPEDTTEITPKVETDVEPQQ